MIIPHPAHLRQLTVIVAIAAGYAAAGMVSTALSAGGIGVWIGNVLVFAIMARDRRLNGWPGLAGIAIGGLAMGLLVVPNPPVAVLYTAAATGSAWLTLKMTSSYFAEAGEPRWTVASLGMILLAICGVHLAVGLSLSVVAGELQQGLTAATGAKWFLANALGAAVFLPFALSVSGNGIRRLADPNIVSPLIAWTGLCCTSMFLCLHFTTFPLVFAMVPLLLTATRLGPFELSVTCMLVGCTVFAVAVSGNAPMVTQSGGFQVAVAITTIVPYLGGLLIRQTANERRQFVESDERHRMAMAKTVIGIVNITLDGRIVDANPAMARILGYSVDELEGRRIQEFTYEPDLPICDTMFRDVYEGLRSHGTLQKRYIRRDGTPFWVRVSFSLFKSADNRESYLVAQVEDIDARRNAETSLAEMQARWDFAMASVGHGIWDLDSRIGQISYSETWTGMIGYQPGEIDGDSDFWLSIIHPDDYDRVRAADLALQDGTSAFFETEYRVRHKEGHYFWILDRGKVIERDADGNVIRSLGTMTDITRRKEAEADLERAAALLADEKERLRVTLDSIGDAVICTDADDCITFMNPIAEQLTRVNAANALGKDLRAVYVSVDEETGESIATQAPAAERRADHHRTMLIRRDGTQCSIREVMSPLKTADGKVGGRVIVFQDFTDSRKLQRRLSHAATHDSLTGLANRANFLARFEELAEDVRKRGNEHQFLFIDLDRFKAVNDNGGHAAGDALLSRIAEAIQDTVRGNDIVARLGGDEFGVLLTDCPVAFGRVAAQKIVDTVSAIDFLWAGKVHRIGASIGLATLDRSSIVVDEVIARADEACYTVKRSGRSGVAVAAHRDVANKRRAAPRR